MTNFDKAEADIGRALFSVTPHEMMYALEKILGDIISNKDENFDDARQEAAKEVIWGLATKVAIHDPPRGASIYNSLKNHFACESIRGRASFDLD